MWSQAVPSRGPEGLSTSGKRGLGICAQPEHGQKRSGTNRGLRRTTVRGTAPSFTAKAVDKITVTSKNRQNVPQLGRADTALGFWSDACLKTISMASFACSPFDHLVGCQKKSTAAKP